MADKKTTPAAEPTRSATGGYASVQDMLDDAMPEFAEEFREYQKVRDLVDAANDALQHVEELREAWRTGALDERDGQGGTRSNRNVDVEVKLRRTLDALGIEPRESLV